MGEAVKEKEKIKRQSDPMIQMSGFSQVNGEQSGICSEVSLIDCELN